MPEYDAFGREIGEDPLQGFRPSAPPKPEPVVAQPAAVEEAREQPVIEAPAPREEIVRRRRPRVRYVRWIVLLALLGVGLGTVANVGVEVGGGIKEFVDEFPSESAPPASDVTGITGDSLIRRENFARAMAALAGVGLGKPLTMRVAPDRIDATLVRGKRLHQIRITAGNELSELASAAAASTRTIPYKAIDPTAPERLVKAGATKKVPASKIDYLVITPGPPPTWAAYYKGGRIVIGDAHGHKQRVL